MKNRFRCKVTGNMPVSLCSLHCSDNFSFASDLPRDQKVVKKWGTLKDHPKCVK